MKNFDFLIIGGGIAGLSYAHEVAKHGSVAVLFKKGFEESSTAWAQGGIAAVDGPDDNFDLHIQDTLVAGVGLCHRDTVELVVREGPDRIHDLIALGTHFDLATDQQHYHLHKEGGHSRRRIFHAADRTGYEIQRALLAATRNDSGITFFTYSNAVDLITTHKLGVELDAPNRVLGAYVLLKDGTIEPFLARKILLATGGAGKVYLYT